MNCPFCGQHNDGDSEIPEMKLYSCQYCSSSELTVEYCNVSADYNWRALTNDRYCVEMNFKDMETKFFQLIDDYQEYLTLKVPKILDIRPENFEQWIHWFEKMRTMA